MIQLSFFPTTTDVSIIIPKFKILPNNRFELIMVKEQEKCKFCGRVVKTHTFKHKYDLTLGGKE